MNIPNFSGRQMPGKPLPIIKSPALGYCVLFGLFFFMLMIVSLGLNLIMPGENDAADLSKVTSIVRIGTVCQALFVFILPALVAALVVTRLPATFLRIDIKPMKWTTAIACIVMVTSIPAMEWIINLNQNMHLPEWLGGLEEWMRDMELNTNSSIGLLEGGGGIGNLIISILIIGVLTGIAEELFFRGALQNLMFSSRMKRHLAVWVAAIIFSAMHMQFFGFVPRMLLGAYFGYLMWWSGSVWVPAIVHAFNNSIVVVVNWIGAIAADGTAIETAAATEMEYDWLTVVLSVAVTAMGIVVLRRRAAIEGRRLSNDCQNPVS